LFNRPEIQEYLDARASLPHKATVYSPYGFSVRPAGFTPDEPRYKVLVERAAFRMRVTVVPDYLAVAIVAAVVSGARNNPARVDRLASTLRGEGWSTDIALSPEAFRVEATYADVVGRSDSELVELGVVSALALSEFVLDQLIVTRPVGEMRSAVERPIDEGSANEVWLYDPSERDRSTQVHRSLENWLIVRLREHGINPFDPAGEPFFDLAWRRGNGMVVCEVKSSANSEVHQLRLGLGQVLQYQSLLEGAGLGPVEPVLLIEGPPADRSWMDICARHGVVLFWPDRWEDIAGRMTAGADDGVA
jgi:hypothetical protein